MKKITSLIELKELILLLELQKAYEGKLLKEQFKTTYQNLRPVNLIKNTFKELVTAPNLKENLLNTALGIIAGYLSKKAIIGNSHNPLKQIAGTLLQMGVTGIVAKNTTGIKSIATQLIHYFSNKMLLHK
jgi:hypothetical protein